MNKNRTSNLIKNSFILSFGTLIPKILTILVLPFLTTYLTTSEYGNYDLVLSATSLIVPVVMMQIQQAVFRFLLSETKKKEKEIYITTSLYFVAFISVVSAPISYLIGQLIGLPKTISIIMCILVVAESIYLLLGQVMRGIGKNLNYSLGVIVYAVINAVTLFFLVAVFRMGLFGVVVSIAIGYVFSALAMLIVTTKEYQIGFNGCNRNVLKEMIAFSAPIVPSSISLWIVNLSDRFVIVYFLGTAANGIYSVANKIPALYTTAYNIFNLAWTETAAQVADVERNPEIYYSELFAKLYSFLVGSMLIIIASSPLFYKLFINEQYYESYFQTAVLYFGVFFNSIVMFYAGIYIALKKTKQVGYSSAAGAVINLGINLFAVGKIGLYAASISTLISYLIIAIYRCLDIQRYIKIKYNIRAILVGIFTMIFSSMAYFSRNHIGYTACILISLVYNIIENKYMISYVMKKVKNKLYKN